MSSSVDVKAETGATVNAPLLSGNTITAPVTFNYSSNTAGNGHIFLLYKLYFGHYFM